MSTISVSANIFINGTSKGNKLFTTNNKMSTTIHLYYSITLSKDFNLSKDLAYELKKITNYNNDTIYEYEMEPLKLINNETYNLYYISRIPVHIAIQFTEKEIKEIKNLSKNLSTSQKEKYYATIAKCRRECRALPPAPMIRTFAVKL